MHLRRKAIVLGFALIFVLPCAKAQTQSSDPADQKLAREIASALGAAGIDSRTTSFKVIVTSDHVVYLTGLMSDRDKIKLAGTVAMKAAPSCRVVNQIHPGFFDDPNHVAGDKTK